MKITKRQLKKLITESLSDGNSIAASILKMLSFREKPFLVGKPDSDKIEKIKEILQDDSTRRELENMLDQFHQGLNDLQAARIGPDTMSQMINAVEDSFQILKSKLN